MEKLQETQKNMKWKENNIKYYDESIILSTEIKENKIEYSFLWKKINLILYTTKRDKFT